MYTILVSSLPLPSCFNCVLWNGFDSWKEIDWYPVLFPFFSASFFFFYSPSFSQPLYDGWVQCIDHCRTNHCQTGRFSSFSVYSTFEIVCRNTLKPHQETPHTGLQLCTVREDRHATLFLRTFEWRIGRLNLRACHHTCRPRFGICRRGSCRRRWWRKTLV